MSRLALGIAVSFAGYAVISSVVALVVAAIWRSGRFSRVNLNPARMATRLVTLRTAPAALGLALSLGVVLPVYLAFEPVREYEPVGPILIVFAALGVIVIGAAISVAARVAVMTRRIQRQWLRSATALDIDPPAGVPAFVIDTPAPIVALVGVVSPRLVAARAVIDACSERELAAIVAHERGHLHARDNFKRWLLTCAPDVLRWMPAHGEIIAVWRDAAEDAADDAATCGRDEARVDLAALLVKIARLAPRFSTPAAVSPFADEDGLDRRVRRLLEPSQATPTRSWRLLFPAIVCATALAVTAAVANPASLKPIYDIIELAVALGR